MAIWTHQEGLEVVLPPLQSRLHASRNLHDVPARLPHHVPQRKLYLSLPKEPKCTMKPARFYAILSSLFGLVLAGIVTLNLRANQPTDIAFIALMGLTTVCLALWSFAERYTAGLNGIRSDLKLILDAIPNLASQAQVPLSTEAADLQMVPCSKCGATPRFVGEMTIQCMSCDHIELRPKTPNLVGASA